MNNKQSYRNPEVKVINIVTSSIMASSGSVQNTAAPAKPTEPKVKPSVPAKITYNIVGDNVLITIPSATGAGKIQEQAVVVPGGDKCIVYDSYLYTMKQFAQNATDIPYYIDKMQQALDFKNQNLSTMDIILKVVLKHISNIVRSFG